MTQFQASFVWLLGPVLAIGLCSPRINTDPVGDVPTPATCTPTVAPTPSPTSAPTAAPTPTPTQCCACPTPTVGPTAVPTATPTTPPTATPTVGPTSTPKPTPTGVQPKPAPVEKFRGDLKATGPWYKRGTRTCRDGGSTIWFWMQGGLKSCDSRSYYLQPADYGHMGVPPGTPPGQPAIDAATCKPVAINFQGRWWDDPRGPQINITQGSSPIVIYGANPYEWTICAEPGRVDFQICPRADFHSCVNPLCTDRSCPCEPVALKPQDGTGCTPRTYTFPKLP